MIEGSTIGTYRVLHLIGEGGMGEVYLGEHTLIGRRAAIKVLRAELLTSEEIVQRFFNEARAVTQITDPGIVQVFDYGVDDENGRAYIVMELLDGEPLGRRVERAGAFAPETALRIARQLATSLSAAHAKNIVHRDLKPENVFLVGDPAVTGGERAKILDFGIAKLTGAEPNMYRTRTGTMMGTPVFMSPEQCRGAGEIDHRTDIYSLGCVMMTMLTGKPPFAGVGSGELIVAHMRETPPLVSERVRGMPALVDNLVDRCLKKEPSERYASMIDVANAIAHAEQLVYGIATGPVLVQRPTPLPITAPYVSGTPTTLSSTAGQLTGTRRPRGLVIGIAATTVLAVGVAVVVALTRGPAPVHEQAATPALPPAADAAVVAQPPPPQPIDAGVAATVPIDAPIVTEVPPDAGVKKKPKPGGGHARPTGTDNTIDRGD